MSGSVSNSKGCTFATFSIRLLTYVCLLVSNLLTFFKKYILQCLLSDEFQSHYKLLYLRAGYQHFKWSKGTSIIHTYVYKLLNPQGWLQRFIRSKEPSGRGTRFFCQRKNSCTRGVFHHYWNRTSRSNLHFLLLPLSFFIQVRNKGISSQRAGSSSQRPGQPQTTFPLALRLLLAQVEMQEKDCSSCFHCQSYCSSTCFTRPSATNPRVSGSFYILRMVR